MQFLHNRPPHNNQLIQPFQYRENAALESLFEPFHLQCRPKERVGQSYHRSVCPCWPAGVLRQCHFHRRGRRPPVDRGGAQEELCPDCRRADRSDHGGPEHSRRRKGAEGMDGHDQRGMVTTGDRFYSPGTDKT